MSFTSYAQNFEDVILWRALKHVEKGFYIDVGAMDPNQDSVTKAFYEQGWRGINIEPVTQWYERLEKERVRDINLQVVAGAQEGETILYEIPDTGLSTINKDIAERHKSQKNYRKIERTILIKTLNEVCSQYHVAPLHFLKIDVEGSEKQVLQGIDFSIIRPWIILIESTLPNTQIENYVEWDPILLAASYEFVYFDGLNRFYIAYEHQELKDNLRTPPNYFDGFVLDGSTPYCNHIMAQAMRASADASAAITQIEHLSVLLEEKNQVLAESQARITEQKTHAQWLQSEWETAKAQSSELAQELVVKAEVLIARDAALAQFKIHNEWLQNEWNTAKARLYELTEELAVKAQALIASDAALTKQQAYSEWLQNEWNASRVRLDELVGQLAIARQGEQRLSEELVQKKQALSTNNDLLTEYQAHSQWLQNEWDATKVQLNEMIAEIALAKQSILGLSEQLTEKSQDLNRCENALIEEKARNQWLQNEWDAAETKIDDLNRELQVVYRSKSWRITWPFRRALQLFRWLISLPKRITKKLVLIAMRFVLAKPDMKFRFLSILKKHPRIKGRLQLLAFHHGLIAHLPDLTPETYNIKLNGIETNVADKVNNGPDVVEPVPDLSLLTPQARHIYLELKQAVLQRQKENI